MRKRDWAAEQARQAVDVVQGGCTREVAAEYLASVLRMAQQRGVVDGARAVAAAKPAEKGALV